MRFFVFTALFVLSFAVSKTADAQNGEPFISSAYLYEVCKRDSTGKEVVPNGSVTCQSYIAGVLDYHNILQSLDTSPNVSICVPKGATLNDIQQIVLQYLDKNAQNDAFVAAPSVTLALHKIFPCKK